MPHYKEEADGVKTRVTSAVFRGIWQNQPTSCFQPVSAGMGHGLPLKYCKTATPGKDQKNKKWAGHIEGMGWATQNRYFLPRRALLVCWRLLHPQHISNQKHYSLQIHQETTCSTKNPKQTLQSNKLASFNYTCQPLSPHKCHISWLWSMIPQQHNEAIFL